MNPYCGVQKKLSNCADFTSNSAKKKKGGKSAIFQDYQNTSDG